MSANPARKPGLPTNDDAERAVLGAILLSLNGRALDIVADVLTPEDFGVPRHQAIYRAMVRLATESKPVDLIAVKDALVRSGELLEVGGPAYLGALADAGSAATNVAYYARLVRGEASRRKVIACADEMQKAAYDGELEAIDVLERAERGLLELSHRASPGEPTRADQLAAEMRVALDQVCSTRRPVSGLGTGLPSLDRSTRGLQPGSLVLLAARPGAGKSALAIQIALHAAASVPVLFFSVEMSRQEQGFRMVSHLADLDAHRLQCGVINPDEQRAAAAALTDLEAHRAIAVDDAGALSVMQIRSKARRMKARQGLGLVVVDYLQLLQHAKADSREQAVAQTSRMLKQLARELEVPFLVLCQLSRAAEAAKDQRPMLSHLRESGALEQDADVVLLIHRPGAKDTGFGTETQTPQVIIAKNRNGPVGDFDVRWDGSVYRFTEIPR